MSADVRVNRRLTIPASEIKLLFSTAGGPGGQHANKAATRVDLSWNVDASTVLGPGQRARIKRRLHNRIDSSGNLRISSDARRSQLQNRKDVLDRLGRIVGEALTPPKKRIPTAPTESSKRRRLHDKKRRAETKRLRRAEPNAD